MNITEKTLRALKILDVNYDDRMNASWFARKMWPDSAAWKIVKNTGNGATSGKGMWLSAGSYLAKLRKQGLAASSVVGNSVVWKISSKGKEELLRYQNNDTSTK